MNYQEQFENIAFYKLHPSYIPFIGENYEKYKILQISESHYCDQIADRKKYGIKYFEDWFSSEKSEIENGYLKNNITRRVCNGVMNNCSFPNFDNPLRSFCRVVLGIEKIRLSKYNQNRKLYSYFSFMNFYQIPAFENAGCFKNSFYSEAKKENINEDVQSQIINQWRTQSTQLIDQVIEILNPKAIVFTSVDAWKSYDINNGKYKSDYRIIRSAHPNRPWNNHQVSLNGKTGKQAFEDGLKRIYFSNK